jgi:hypothetical protein
MRLIVPLNWLITPDVGNMQEKLSITQVLNAVNRRDRHFYNNLSTEKQKQFNAFIMMRYISNPSVSPEIEQWFITKTHEYVNRHFWQLNRKHPELIWNLYASVGVGAACKYQYLNSVNVVSKNKTVNLLAEYYPNMKLDDIQTLAAIMTQQDIDNLIHQMEPNS